MDTPHLDHLRKSEEITKRSPKTCMESYGAYLCSALDLPRLDWLRYDDFVDGIFPPRY